MLLAAVLVAGLAWTLPTKASAQIHVTEATLAGVTRAVWNPNGCGVAGPGNGTLGAYGTSSPAGNWTPYTAAACDGLFNCSFTPDSSQACPTGSWPCGDPAYGCAKDFRVKYTCAGDATVKEIYVPVESAAYPVVLACPRDCAVSAWSDWSTCSASCGGGSQSRTRTVTTQPANGGAACPELSESQACNTQGCPVDCQVSSAGFGPCSVSCGGGTQTELLTVVTPAANGGAACREPQTQACNTQGCPVDCVVSSAGFGACSVSCGGGTQTELLSVVTPSANGGAACREPQTQACNTQSCDTDGDGVNDAADSCPGTSSGAKVNASGCSGAQLVEGSCPSSGSYKNHGAYVSCVAKAANAALAAGLLTSAEKDAIVSTAAKSTIGK